MGYCSSCGESLDGRFCRMCGTPVDAAAHKPAHAVPNTDFDSLFRRAEGEVNPHSRTQLLPPVEADYRMPPPPSGTLPAYAPTAATRQVDAFSASPTQLSYPQQPGNGVPGGPDQVPPGEQWDDDDEPAVRKPVLWGALAAVAVVSAIILGLIYLGGGNGGAGAAGSATDTATAPATGATAQQSVEAVQLAPGSASPSPSASPSASQSQPAAGGTTLPLSQGSTGALVHYVQSRLHSLGFYHHDATGQYDAATAQAVIDFQAHAGVTGDPAAVVGRSTYTALIAAGTRTNLHYGQRSADVKRLQQALNSAEGAHLDVNGRFDAATFGAVRAYQAAVGVQQTGSMNAATWSALQSGKLAG
ncbi:MAG: peptidoglycan-binding protein [Actinocrinis sp.]